MALTITHVFSLYINRSTKQLHVIHGYVQSLIDIHNLSPTLQSDRCNRQSSVLVVFTHRFECTHHCHVLSRNL